MLSRAVGLVILVASLLWPHPHAASSQGSPHPITKADALKQVRVSSLAGWHEATSDESRFRILFPGVPRIDDDVASIKGFKLHDSSGNWAASCSDLGLAVPNENSALKKAYQQALDAMMRGRSYVFVAGDIFLYERLGTEFILDTSGRVSYMRAFIFGRRLYTLSVTRKKSTRSGNVIPADVQQFFDSFAYWD